MFKKIAVTISAVAFVMLAVALAPGVPTVLATVRTSVATDEAKLNQPLAQQSCAAFETWFLDPTCRQTHVKKVARTKHQLATTKPGERRVRMGLGEACTYPLGQPS